MSLRAKAILIAVVTVLGFVVTEAWVAQSVLSAGFDRLERDAVARSVRTLEGHMPFEYQVVAGKLEAFGATESWAAAARTAGAGDGAALPTPEAVAARELDFLVVDAIDGTPLARVVAPEAAADASVVARAVTDVRPESERVAGLLRVGSETAIVVAAPLRTDDGTLAGWIRIGRTFDDAMVAVIEELTHLAIDVAPWDGGALSETFGRAREEIRSGVDRPVAPLDEDTIVGYTRLLDLNGDPELLVRVATPRPIAAQARESRASLTRASVVVGAAVVVLVLFVLQRGLLDRFLRFGSEVRRIADAGDASRRVAVRGGDELAQLARDVNTMLSSLEGAQAELRSSEERYALAAEGANDGLWEWSSASGGVRYSPRFVELLGGVSGSGASDRLWSERIHPDDRARFEEKWARVRSGRDRFLDDEHRVRGEGGAWRWMLARGAARPGEEDTPLRVAGSLTDLTERGVFDAATGLPNRVLLDARLDRARSDPRSLATVLLSVVFEGWAEARDAIGARAAERLSLEAVRRTQRLLEPDEMLARVGEESFAVVTDRHPDDASVERFVRTLRTAFETPIRPPGDAEEGGASGGAAWTAASDSGSGSAFGTGVRLVPVVGAVRNAERYEDPKRLLRHAALARDEAVAHDGRFAWFEPAMERRLLDRRRTEAELRTAIGEGRLALAYQPIVELASGSLHAFEALVRWPHPERGTVSPGVFVPIAEASDLMVPLGAWVLREAARQARSFDATGGPAAGRVLHVNLSARQLEDAGLEDLVAEAVATVGGPDRIELEVTETVMMRNADRATRVLRGICARGVRLAIDDFGTGHSSLAYLHDLPTHTLKIDRTFVGRMTTDARSAAIVRTIAQLAASLGMEVVAEGIETPEQLAAVRAEGVRYGQGFLFARPMPPEEAAAWSPPDLSRVPRPAPTRPLGVLPPPR